MIALIIRIQLPLQDAKEHLAALADKLGSSLTDIDVWKSYSCVLALLFSIFYRTSNGCP